MPMMTPTMPKTNPFRALVKMAFSLKSSANPLIAIKTRMRL